MIHCQAQLQSRCILLFLGEEKHKNRLLKTDEFYLNTYIANVARKNMYSFKDGLMRFYFWHALQETVVQDRDQLRVTLLDRSSPGEDPNDGFKIFLCTFRFM
jgi:hypothetical protein